MASHYSQHTTKYKADVTDKPTCGGAEFARAEHIPVFTFPAPKSGAFPGLSTEELVAALTGEPVGAEFALLAGFLKVWCCVYVCVAAACLAAATPALAPPPTLPLLKTNKTHPQKTTTKARAARGVPRV